MLKDYRPILGKFGGSFYVLGVGERGVCQVFVIISLGCIRVIN